MSVETSLRQWVLSTIRTVLSELDLPSVQVPVSSPPDPAMGDLALPLGFALAKPLRMAPPQALAKVVPSLMAHWGEGIVCEIQGGFLNLRFSDAWLWQKGMAYAGKTGITPKKETVFLEYVSANPTGPLHIGHGRWAVMGSVLAQLFREIGHQVHTEFYINDAGKQIDNLYASVLAVREGRPIPEDGYHGAYIHTIAASGEDPVCVNLAEQRQDLSDIGVVFDRWYSEKNLHDTGQVLEAIATLIAKGVTYEEGGALWFRSTAFGDDKDRVLRKADGGLTYFAVDVAYHMDKVSRCDGRIINLWGADHHGYVSRVRAALQAVFGETRSKEPAFTVLLGQMVALFRHGEPVRMSKRTGDMVRLSEVTEEVGADAVRYYLASKGFDSHIDFDLEKAKEKSSENPVYYVQYAHARLCGVLRKAGHEGVDTFLGELHPKERALLLQLTEYGDAVADAAQNCAPHRFVQYTYDLARASHHVYEACPVLGSPFADQRLALLAKTRDVLAQSLAVLGISAPSTM